MIKRIYKAIILFFIFCGAVVFFGSGLGSSLVEEGKTINQGEESFPILSVSTQGQVINTLYGYSGSIDPAIVRQSITPVGKDKKITLRVQDGTQKIKKLRYQIINSESGEVYEENSMSALDEQKSEIPLTFNYGFESSKEYILSLIATTQGGQVIHYYSRIKYYMDDTHLAGKVGFAMKFHEDTFSKDKASDLAGYLETSPGQTNDDLSHVSIKSSVDMITWGGLSPKMVTQNVVPIVKEYNTETACVLLNYYVKASTSVGEERYHVQEFYRVRYSGGRYFLLGYDRTMDAVYNSQLVSTKKNQLKFGITSETDMDILTTDDDKTVFYARDGILYRYDLNKNDLKEIYSVNSKNASENYRLNDEQDIRVNRIDNEGNLYFTVYGYIPRGQYEGKVAIVLYKYSKANQSIEELVYLPQDTTYQQLKEDFDTYSYVNSKSIYYFKVGSVVYSYNILGRRLEKIVNGVSADGFEVLRGSNCYAWSSDLEKGYGETVTIYNLENDSKLEIKAPDDDTYVRLLGGIDSNIVYGYVRKADITKTAEGTEIVPCYEMDIADVKGKVLKSYKKGGQYITHVSVNGNVLTMERRKKVGNSYKKIAEDSILNQENKEKASVALASRSTTNTLNEWYLNLPYGYVLTRAPKLQEYEDTLVTSERAVHLDSPKVTRYYVYAFGKITGAYENPAHAITKADEQMGVVVSSKHQLVWERGGSFLMNTIAGIENTSVGNGINNVGACAYMVLKANHVSADAKELSASGDSLYDMLAKHLERPVNLTGCNLEEVLYFVSNGKPVIGMISSSKAVVITAYDTRSVTYYNPDTGTSTKANRKDAERMFKAAGNAFVSYMNDEKGMK